MKRISIVIFSLCISSLASADDVADQSAGIKCKPAKDLIKVITKMSSLKPEQTDTVAASPKMKLTALADREFPQRLFVRSESNEIDLPIDAEGRVSGLSVLSGMSKKSEFCVEDKYLIENSDEENSMSVSMDFDISYKNTSGVHEIAELRDGLEDGRAHIKKLVPAPFRAMIPKFDHVLIEYLDEDGETLDTSPQISAYKGDEKLDGLKLERLENMHFVNVDQLEELGADGLRINGGTYKMDPSPSLEKIKKLTKDDK